MPGKFRHISTASQPSTTSVEMAETLSYQTIRSANQAREADEQKTESRKKNLLILVLHYLHEEGYVDSASTLAKETNIDLNKFEVCDNVDLDTVLMEYESFYYIKFAKYPKITKKLSSGDERTLKRPAKLKSKKTFDDTSLVRSKTFHSSPLHNLPNKYATEERISTSAGAKDTRSHNVGSGLPSLKNTPVKSIRRASDDCKPSKNPGSGDQRQKSQANQSNGNNSPSQPDPLSLQGLVVHGNQTSDMQDHPHGGKQKNKFGQIIDMRSMINDATKLNVEEGFDDNKLLKPLGGYMAYTQEWRDLAQTISRDIFSNNPDVRWDDIIGLDAAKRLVKEAVVYPIKYPQLFTGILSPWKGLLLYGPPGTGKTLLAKAVATECGTTFFNISASSIVSKWRGDSEKLVRVLFELARFHAPSTIFLDELESLMGQRGGGGGGEHEGSRRMKTELLVQMDGLAKSDDLVFLLAASNLPWELDHAMLRRLEKRILVDLPTEDARKAMFHHHLPSQVFTNKENGIELTTELDYNILAKTTEGYSGSDIRLVCKEAAMRPVRKIFTALETYDEEVPLHIKLDTITTYDVECALKHTKPSARNLVGKYVAWQKEYESV